MALLTFTGLKTGQQAQVKTDGIVGEIVACGWDPSTSKVVVGLQTEAADKSIVTQTFDADDIQEPSP